MTLSAKHKPVVIIIRDGWGANPYAQWNHANAIHLASTPVDYRLMASYPHVLIKTSGEDVGLPDGVMGNSEVGHQNIGAGRVVERELMRITGRIRDGSFFDNPALSEAFHRAVKTGGCVHIMGLCSNGRVHSDLGHLDAVLDLSARLSFPPDRVFVHAFTDGRDTSPRGGLDFIRGIEAKCKALKINPITSVCGRFFAMDRDNRWERVKVAYDLLTGRGGISKDDLCSPVCARFDTAQQAVAHYYEHPSDPNMCGDEFVTPSVTAPQDSSCTDASRGLKPRGSVGRIVDGDSVIFFNYRGDRPRELVKAFTYAEFPFDGVAKDGTPQRMGFDRGGPKLDLYFVTMTGYESGLPVEVAFEKPPKMADTLGEYLSGLGLNQFRCAETEKFPHVTYFFNDYREEPFVGEQRRLVNSPRDVLTYDQKPRMSADEITEAMLAAITTGRYDAMILNYANGDMVGHTGNLTASTEAVETVDQCVGRVVDAILQQGGAAIVTADHGNCEQMIHPETGEPHTAHTTYPVELIVVADEVKGKALREGGRLADIAPTALALMGLRKPPAMTGESLLHRRD